MSTKTRKYTPKPRATLALRGTISSPELKLDHSSQLAAEWARRWLKRPECLGVDPLTSGTMRRALSVYVAHLQRADLDPQQEARAVRSASSALRPDLEDRQAAWKRLEAHQQGEPFPSFADVLHDPQRATDWVAFNARVDELVDQITLTTKKRKMP
jgi:hypothetical protein